MNTEKILLCAVYKQNGRTFVDIPSDIDLYQAYGVLSTYVKDLEKYLIDEWRQE